MRSKDTASRRPGSMPVYTLRFPGKLWDALLEQEVFLSYLPAESRAAYEAATETRRAVGSTRTVEGRSVDLLPILTRLQVMVRGIRRGITTATRYGVDLQQLDRCAHQMLTITKEKR